jgi:exopolysaccharide production protein ExoY
MARLNECQASNDEELDSASGGSAALPGAGAVPELSATRFHNANFITDAGGKMKEAASYLASLGLSSLSPVKPVGLSGKRLIDVALAGFGIVVLSPLFLLCFAACLLSSPGPVLFGHRRIGFQGKYFQCFKFRTMVINGEEVLRAYLASHPEARAEWEATRKLRFDPRVTAIGSILRKTSLDEIPQLFNVLWGEMSIVGPRPVTEEELARYSTRVKSYLACRPGITGLWQVSGRSGTTYRKRVACDTYYARHWSMILDARIIVATVSALLDSSNAY